MQARMKLLPPRLPHAEPRLTHRLRRWCRAPSVFGVDRELLFGHWQGEQRTQEHQPSVPAVAFEVLAEHLGISDAVEDVH